MMTDRCTSSLRETQLGFGFTSKWSCDCNAKPQTNSVARYDIGHLVAKAISVDGFMKRYLHGITIESNLLATTAIFLLCMVTSFSTLSRCDENPTPKDRAMSCNDQNDCYRHARPHIMLCRNRNKYRKCLTLTMTETIFSDAISPILRHTLRPPQLLDGVVGQDEKLKRQSIMPSHDGRMDGAWAMRT